MNAEITVVEKSGGILSKSISLRADGTINADGSACVMSRGSAHRAKVADVHAFAALIEGLKPYQAITLGALRDDLLIGSGSSPRTSSTASPSRTSSPAQATISSTGRAGRRSR
jgi:hypothetical protein